VAIWASLAPITALLLGHRRAAAVLMAANALLLAASTLVPAPTSEVIPAWLRQDLFVLNLVGAPVLTLLLVRLFAGGREDALDSVRRVVGRYFSRDLARILLADPRRAELGGEVADVSVLFADLGSYSTYAEHRAPADVVDMLNEYFGAIIPVILELGGTPIQLAGDAVMAVFGAPHAQADHAQRACRAAVSILARTEALAAGPMHGPRLHIGVNSGPALVGNIGSDEYRNFTAIGDTTNLAARLQGLAEPGQVVIGPTTATALAGTFVLASLGLVTVKGRVQPTEAFALSGAAGEPPA
jgi:class 3 adenylate cyclase